MSLPEHRPTSSTNVCSIILKMLTWLSMSLLITLELETILMIEIDTKLLDNGTQLNVLQERMK